MTQTTDPGFNADLWHLLFGVGHPALLAKQGAFRTEGVPPRCKLCLAPFGELPEGGWSDEHPGPSNRNPRYCSLCDVFIRANPGGAKVTMSVVFADVRDSTRLSEELPLEEYVRRMNDFYRRVTAVFVDADGFMLDVVGDEVFALFPAGFSGVSPDDAGKEGAELERARVALAAKKAFGAAERLAAVCRRGAEGDFAFGVAAHTGDMYVGTVGGAEDGIADIRVWGAEVNKAARLCSAARPGEALVSEATLDVAGVPAREYPREVLTLKGFSQPVVARRVGVVAPAAAPV